MRLVGKKVSDEKLERWEAKLEKKTNGKGVYELQTSLTTCFFIIVAVLLRF